MVLGGADTACGQVSPNVKGVTLRLNCSTGRINTKAIASLTGERILDIGIINASTDDKTICAHSAFEGREGINCSKYLSTDKIEAEINTKCVGQDGCVLDQFDTNLYRKNPPAKGTQEYAECFGDGSEIFV